MQKIIFMFFEFFDLVKNYITVGVKLLPPRGLRRTGKTAGGGGNCDFALEFNPLPVVLENLLDMSNRGGGSNLTPTVMFYMPHKMRRKVRENHDFLPRKNFHRKKK